MKTLNDCYNVPRIEQTGKNCGPTALTQLFHYFDIDQSVEETIEQTSMIPGLGTYDGNLGCTAIKKGFKVTITPQNLNVFDPTWFSLNREALLSKLRARAEIIEDKYLVASTNGFIDFLELGGELEFKHYSEDLLFEKLALGPFIVGLCSTYLYGEMRDKGGVKDDVKGERLGHFVVVDGYNSETDEFTIKDPWHSIPFSPNGEYMLKGDKLITSMLLGEATYDATIVQLFN